MFLGQADKRINNNRRKRFGDYFTGPQIDPESSSGQRFGADSRFNTRSQIESGTLNFTKSKIRGFTLIELLVVISIIALLSTIILGAVNDAREKAQVKKKNEIARQYINALELYRDDNINSPNTINGYPATTSLFRCLGYGSTEPCYASFVGNSTLNTSIENYYPSLPKDADYSIQVGSNEAKGIMYRCSSQTSCYLRWYISENSDCINGITTYSGSTYTICSYPFNNTEF